VPILQASALHADGLEAQVMLQSNRIYAPTASCCLLAFVLFGCVSRAVSDLSHSEGVPQKKVSYAGLDLNSEEGARILFRRLKFAAGQVCEPLEGQRLEQKQRWRECYERALANAVTQVNYPQVTMLYQASVETPLFH
jgi:UrcA family protein